MNKEDFVSLEVAKLLKEKGFNVECEFELKEEIKIHNNEDEVKYWACHRYKCPTLYEAQKWLRSTKMINVEVSYMSGDYWIYEVLTIPKHDLVGLSDRENVKYDTYEEALNAGILEALKMI